MKKEYVLQQVQLVVLDRNLSEGTLRTTFGKDNTKQDVEFLVDSLTDIIQKKY